MTKQKTNENVCAWYITAQRNRQGEGTSFIDRTQKDLECFDCLDFYNTNCQNYIESDEKHDI